MQKVGGQAVINGVMMLKDDKLAIAIRKDNKIIVKKEKINLLGKKFKKFYFVRGIFSLYDMLRLGIKSLNWSASQAEDNEPTQKNNAFLTITIFILSIALALIIFKGLPLLVANFFIKKSNILFNIIDGATKLFLFIAYVYLISFMKDVKTLFQYHGAEHKVVHCYEDKKPLTIQNAKKYPTYHPRCGTNFLTVVIITSIFFYSLIPFSTSLILKYLLRILFLPIIIGVSFEIIKFSNNFNLGFLNYPGELVQRITSQEPSEKQLEVGITSLKSVL